MHIRSLLNVRMVKAFLCVCVCHRRRHRRSSSLLLLILLLHNQSLFATIQFYCVAQLNISLKIKGIKCTTHWYRQFTSFTCDSIPGYTTKINKTTKPNQTNRSHFKTKSVRMGTIATRCASERKRVNGIWLDWIWNWIWVRINAHIGLSPGSKRTKHYLGAVADIAQKQNINRFYRHWYISVYQLISITSKCLCHDNRLGFYSLVFRCLALPCVFYERFMSKPIKYTKTEPMRSTTVVAWQRESMELHARIVCANEK